MPNLQYYWKCLMVPFIGASHFDDSKDGPDLFTVGYFVWGLSSCFSFLDWTILCASSSIFHGTTKIYSYPHWVAWTYIDEIVLFLVNAWYDFFFWFSRYAIWHCPHLRSIFYGRGSHVACIQSFPFSTGMFHMKILST